MTETLTSGHVLTLRYGKGYHGSATSLRRERIDRTCRTRLAPLPAIDRQMGAMLEARERGRRFFEYLRRSPMVSSRSASTAPSR